MPRLTQPPEMPRRVADAIEIIGNRARTELLHHLRTDGPLTTTELADHIGASRASTHAHLLQLEAFGLVDADEQQGQRSGRTVRWTVNRQQVRELAQQWSNYAAGP
jgi:DNA-binding transcriptional ArsR family regulator